MWVLILPCPLQDYRMRRLGPLRTSILGARRRRDGPGRTSHRRAGQAQGARSQGERIHWERIRRYPPFPLLILIPCDPLSFPPPQPQSLCQRIICPPRILYPSRETHASLPFRQNVEFSSIADIKGQCEAMAKKATMMRVLGDVALANDYAAKYLDLKSEWRNELELEP